MKLNKSHCLSTVLNYWQIWRIGRDTCPPPPTPANISDLIIFHICYALLRGFAPLLPLTPPPPPPISYRFVLLLVVTSHIDTLNWLMIKLYWKLQ